MFLIDFDGTISRQDVCCAMVTEFASEGWESINRQWEAGTLSTEECAQLTLELMDVEPEQLDAFFEKADIDNSFIEFVTWAEHQEYPISILSDGYDNYIQRILTGYGLNIPYYANHLEYEEGWRIKCLHRDKNCQKCGVCKTELMHKLLRPGYISIYIGDGYSDICPAEYADIVFAKDNLVPLCREKGIPFYQYIDFHDIKVKVQELRANSKLSNKL
ncbi:MAG: MtnX-like HAD-IB family phosphatase [Syntrophomonas sp.]